MYTELSRSEDNLGLVKCPDELELRAETLVENSVFSTCFVFIVQCQILDFVLAHLKRFKYI